MTNSSFIVFVPWTTASAPPTNWPNAPPEWARSLFDDAEPGIEGARAVADREPNGELERRAVSLAARVVDLAAERDALAETSTGSRRRWRRTSPRWPGPSSRRG